VVVLTVAATIAVVFVIVAAFLFLRMLRMPRRSFSGSAPPPAIELQDALRRDVTALVDIGPRSVDTPDTYARAAGFIEESFRAGGYATSRETFVVDDVDCANIVAELRGTSNEIVVVGAHYDTVDDSPGADDNGSGVAALLALARHFAAARPKRTIRFVAFANEEPPYFMSERMGSFVHASRARERGETIAAMLCLESIGYFNDAPQSQEYPAMLEHVFPSTANFIAFASNIGSATLLRRCVATFRKHATIPSEGAALPEAVPGIAWSDQWSFWRNGYDAVMVTDTALFRNPHYHTEHDVAATLDYERLARVVEGLTFVVLGLAERMKDEG